MTLNLDDYDEYVFHLPTWGRLKRKSPRPEDDQTPGEWHVLTDLVAHKGRDPEHDPYATVGYITICNEHGYLHRGATELRTEWPTDGYWCHRCLLRSKGTALPQP
jgi:hypothetical protein